MGLLNVDGYYNSLLTFIDKAVDDGFIKPFQRNIFVSAPNAEELVQKLEVDVPLFPHKKIKIPILFSFSFSHNNHSLLFLQEYEPVHDEVVSKLSWENEQVGYNSTLQAEIAR